MLKRINMADKPLTLKPNFVDETIEVHKSIDCGPMIEMNRFEANAGVNRKEEGVMGRKIASVPMDILHHWKRKHGVDYMLINKDPDQRVRFYKLLHEWRDFKTYDGGLKH
jgi:hypothetical protein